MKVDAVQREPEALPAKSNSMEADHFERPWQLGGVSMILPGSEYRRLGESSSDDVVRFKARECRAYDVAVWTLLEIAQQVHPVLLESEI
jgi:hypothetical protein